jgi:hypothetical protein
MTSTKCPLHVAKDYCHHLSRTHSCLNFFADDVECLHTIDSIHVSPSVVLRHIHHLQLRSVGSWSVGWPFVHLLLLGQQFRHPSAAHLTTAEMFTDMPLTLLREAYPSRLESDTCLSARTISLTYLSYYILTDGYFVLVNAAVSLQCV